jgi:hypothetical protein
MIPPAGAAAAGRSVIPRAGAPFRRVRPGSASPGARFEVDDQVSS